MKYIFVLFFLFYPSFVLSNDLHIIYDSGHTFSMKKYYGDQRIETDTGISKKPMSMLSFPIRTPNMSSGIVKPKKFSIPHLQTPIFIIGQDELSKKWLISRKSELIKIGAIGILVDVDDINTVNKIQNLVSELKLLPASAEDIAKQLNLKHYPILISRFGIEQ